MQLSSLLLSATFLVSSVLSLPTLGTFSESSDASLMLKRQYESVDYSNLMFGRDITDSLEKRIVYNPHITSPDSSTVWVAGKTYTVTWDTTDIPAEAEEYKGMIKLGFTPADGEGGLNLKWDLADGFDIKSGEASVTLPADLKERNDYIVVVFGDSGNASPTFTIKAAQEEGEGEGLGEKIQQEVQQKLNQAFAKADFEN